MKRIALNIMAAALLLGSVTATFAADEKDGKIAQRKENQQKRIGNGVKNGSMTPKETAKAEKQESNLNREIRTDRKQNGGNLTNNQKQQVNQQQNKLSKEIYTDKHNDKNQQN
jgi:hypothetical protein